MISMVSSTLSDGVKFCQHRSSVTLYGDCDFFRNGLHNDQHDCSRGRRMRCVNGCSPSRSRCVTGCSPSWRRCALTIPLHRPGGTLPPWGVDSVTGAPPPRGGAPSPAPKAPEKFFAHFVSLFRLLMGKVIPPKSDFFWQTPPGGVVSD